MKKLFQPLNKLHIYWVLLYLRFPFKASAENTLISLSMNDMEVSLLLTTVGTLDASQWTGRLTSTYKISRKLHLQLSSSYINVMPFGLCNSPSTFHRVRGSEVSYKTYVACEIYLTYCHRRSLVEHLGRFASALILSWQTSVLNSRLEGSAKHLQLV